MERVAVTAPEVERRSRRVWLFLLFSSLVRLGLHGVVPTKRAAVPNVRCDEWSLRAANLIHAHGKLRLLSTNSFLIAAAVCPCRVAPSRAGWEQCRGFLLGLEQNRANPFSCNSKDSRAFFECVLVAISASRSVPETTNFPLTIGHFPENRCPLLGSERFEKWGYGRSFRCLVAHLISPVRFGVGSGLSRFVEQFKSSVAANLGSAIIRHEPVSRKDRDPSVLGFERSDIDEMKQATGCL